MTRGRVHGEGEARLGWCGGGADAEVGASSSPKRVECTTTSKLTPDVAGVDRGEHEHAAAQRPASPPSRVPCLERCGTLHGPGNIIWGPVATAARRQLECKCKGQDDAQARNSTDAFYWPEGASHVCGTEAGKAERSVCVSAEEGPQRHSRQPRHQAMRNWLRILRRKGGESRFKRKCAPVAEGKQPSHKALCFVARDKPWNVTALHTALRTAI